MNFENIGTIDMIVLLTTLAIILMSVKVFLLAKKVKRMPKGVTYVKNLEEDQNGGILTTHGMVRDKNGKGVIADSRPSNTYLNSILN